MDKHFRVVTLASTDEPQTLVWKAMHQDYSEGFVGNCTYPPTEADAGTKVIKHLLAGGKGHFGPLEHPQITLAVGGFPHSVMQQARTHRVGVSFDVQSGRYTGKRVLDLFASECPSYHELEEVFYIRPEGDYTDRQGKKYTFSEVDRQRYLDATLASAEAFNRFITHGHAEEHARELLPYSVRQNFVVSFNLRSLMHFLDLRAKLDAQLEIRQLCDLLMIEFTRWTPDIAVWYLENRWAKARLAP
jgi:thymidylate synthase (FAD)